MGNRLVADAVLKPYMGNQGAKAASKKRSGGVGGGSSYGSSGDDSVSEEAFGRSTAGGGGRGSGRGSGGVGGAGGGGGASGSAARTEGSKNLKWSNLSTAPLTTTNVGPGSKKLGAKTASETVTYSDENYVSDTDIFEKLNRVSPEDRIVTLSAARIGGGSTERKRELHVPTQRNSTFSTGNDKGVRHVTFGGAWESDSPTSTTQPPPPPPSPESKGILRRSQLRQTSVQTTSRDNRGHEKISDSNSKNNIKIKHMGK